MNFQGGNVVGLLRLEPKRHGDRRGFFAETYSQRAYAALGMDATFVKDNPFALNNLQDIENA